ncbi:hypothetical protein [[Phormidium] sp. ETS-05]|nr:hypothetical protein [[Phormidium] sp. ETS-05]
MTKDKGQRTKDKGQRTNDKGQLCVYLPKSLPCAATWSVGERTSKL